MTFVSGTGGPESLSAIPPQDATPAYIGKRGANVYKLSDIPVHLTEKPVELAVRAMTYSSKPGENVLDLFGSSGSTLIAVEKTGRRSFLMELAPLYCDVIVRRWEDFTGKKASRETLPSDGAALQETRK